MAIPTITVVEKQNSGGEGSMPPHQETALPFNEPNPHLAAAQEGALQRIDAALDRCRQATACPETGAVICIDACGEYRAAKIAARTLGLNLGPVRMRK
jgi:hypothetical protein